jgi:tetratricopeptide (TPR) repeat protein
MIKTTLLLGALLLWTDTVGAQPIDPAKEYEDCMALAAKDAQRAFDKAVTWKGLGGGEAAEHCAGAALVGLGQYAEAARRLELLATIARQPAEAKAELLAQAAQALMMGDNVQVLTKAIELDPSRPVLLIDRSFAWAALGNYQEAKLDLDKAIGISPIRAEAWAFRASARRMLNDMEGAMADTERALSLDPEFPEGLLERGILKRLRGDNAGARSDWLKILQTSPNSEAAVEARTNIEKMDVKQ